jgi:hypothetical protein
MYKLTEQGVLRLKDGYHIPFVEDNRDYQEYKKWLMLGNTPQEIYTEEEKYLMRVASFSNHVQEHLDKTAQTRNYDGIMSLCTYATSTNEKFRREGQAGVEWRDAVWSKCYEILEEVQAGTRTAPTDIISELPVFTWGD